MFRESSAIDSERTAASVRPLYAEYTKNENWFDGTPDSVDRRIAQAKRISNLCKAACVRLAGREAGAQYIALAHEMDSDRASLEGLRRDLLTAAMDRYAEAEALPPQPTEFAEDDPVSRSPVGAMAKMMWNGSPMTGQEETPAFNPGPQRPSREASLRAEARYFIAEQECDDLGELLIRARNHAERVASTLPARQAQTVVSSFVNAVSSEYRTAARDYNIDHYKEYAHRNGLHPGDEETADRYSREHGVPLEVSSDYAMRFASRNSRTASLNDFPADFMYLE